MSDTRLRKAERAALLSGSPEDEAALTRERARIGLLACGHEPGEWGLCLRCPPEGAVLVGQIAESGYRRQSTHLARFSPWLGGGRIPYAHCMGDPVRSYARLVRPYVRRSPESQARWGVPACGRCQRAIRSQGGAEAARTIQLASVAP